MRVPLGNDEWCLYDSSDSPDHECVEFHGSEALALRWASQFRGDLFAQSGEGFGEFGHSGTPLFSGEKARSRGSAVGSLRVERRDIHGF